MSALAVPQRRVKRKSFDQLTKYGKRKSLRDVRGLFKVKGVEYRVPVSRMAGFVIQQVIFFKILSEAAEI